MSMRKKRSVVAAGIQARRWCGACWLAIFAIVLARPTAAQQPTPQELTRPGAEHEVLHALVGSWDVHLGQGSEEPGADPIGTADARLRLGDRFLEVEVVAESGPIRHAVYTFGFDARHGEYTVVVMDDNGTYWVTARGTRDGTRIPMYGSDDDPVMSSMGLVKEFLIALEIASDQRFEVGTYYIDNRTPARTELPALTFQFRRAH